MNDISFARFRFRVPVLALSLLAFGLYLSGCASFPGKDLPMYTYTDLAPAPADKDKMCLETSPTGTLQDEIREFIDTTFTILEKSGFFLKAPEHCKQNDEEKLTDIKWIFRNDTPVENRVFAFVSGFVSGFTFTILPAFERDELLLKVQFLKSGRLMKEYAYREHVDTWMHLSTLFITSDHKPNDITREIYHRMIMNFLYDYSRDMHQAKRNAMDQ